MMLHKSVVKVANMDQAAIITTYYYLVRQLLFFHHKNNWPSSFAMDMFIFTSLPSFLQRFSLELGFKYILCSISKSQLIF